MVLYTCPRCAYSTTKKYNIKTHIHRKKICNNTVSDIVPKDVEEDILDGDTRSRLELLRENRSLKRELDSSKPKIDSLEKENKTLKDALEKYTSKYKPGYIYVLHNPTFETWGENIYKIGCSNDPERRLKDLSTSYLSESVILYKSKLFENKIKAEQKLFKEIDHYRSNNRREFFDIPYQTLVTYIENIDVSHRESDTAL